MAYSILSSFLPPPPQPTGAKKRYPGCTIIATSAPIDLPYSAGLFGPEIALYLNQLLAESATESVYAGAAGTVIQGLTLSVFSGLTITVAAGVANAYGQCEFAGANIVCPYSTASINYVWLQISPWSNTSNSSGTLQITPTTTPPSGGFPIYLGSFPTVSGVIGAFDYSGVLYPGPIPYRFTGDAGAPVDTPAAGTVFLTTTAYGTYLWTGTAYVMLPALPQQTFNFVANADLTLIQPLYAADMLILTDTGTVLTGGVSVIYPLVPSGVIGLYNATAQTLTIKGTGATGFTVATGKRVTFYVDATDAHQLSSAF